MLESLMNFKEVNKSPQLTFLWAFLITTVGILFSTQISYKVALSETVINLSGIFSVLFTIIPSVYFLTFLIKKEESIEEDEIKRHYEKKFWERHEKDLMFFIFFFLGVTLAFAVWAFVLPSDTFHIQISKIQEIRSGMTGNIVSRSNFNSFIIIVMNNLEVMILAFVFSLLFGAGAVFIIVWNASVLGVFIGNLAKSIIEIPIVTLSFLPHGIPEVLGYLCAGLSGGILSAAIMRCHKTYILKRIFIDTSEIFLLGAVLIVIAAAVEVYL